VESAFTASTGKVNNHRLLPFIAVVLQDNKISLQNKKYSSVWTGIYNGNEGTPKKAPVFKPGHEFFPIQLYQVLLVVLPF